MASDYSKSRPLYPIEVIAALLRKLAIAPVISIIMPFVAKNRKRIMNRRLRDTRWESIHDSSNDHSILGWMGTRRTIQQKYMRNRMGVERSGNFYDGRSMLQQIKGTTAQIQTLRSQHFDRSARISPVDGKYESSDLAPVLGNLAHYNTRYYTP